MPAAPTRFFLLAALLSCSAGAAAQDPLRIAAAQRAPLRDIDALETLCDGDLPIRTWLSRLTSRHARSPRWSSGPCVTDIQPTISDDPPAPSRGQCVQAHILPRNPTSATDRLMIELYMRSERGGRRPYAFRAVETPDGEQMRSRLEFENFWIARFPGVRLPACRQLRAP
ncbi:hypothetical protein [Plastoroseomonas arctica]|uniref:Secreted protein n=1 Tax=Plastoroseomonas arctica TaxID=1509237 RepID=A0AAF1JYS6_9PROT|nr:hypothetical protein [Plastoroseomonas arctica]MBR0656200.1 hypothetical protein [Plastoroseomonas arctica]